MPRLLLGPRSGGVGPQARARQPGRQHARHRPGDSSCLLMHWVSGMFHIACRNAPMALKAWLSACPSPTRWKPPDEVGPRRCCQDQAGRSRGCECKAVVRHVQSVHAFTPSRTACRGCHQSGTKLAAHNDIGVLLVLQAKKRSRASGILAAASARAAEAEGAPAVELSPSAVTIEAGSPPAELLFLRNSGTATAAFSLAPAGVSCWLGQAHSPWASLSPGRAQML